MRPIASILLAVSVTSCAGPRQRGAETEGWLCISRLATTTTDSDADGETDRIETVTYDDAGRWLTREIDDYGGITDTYTCAYDGAGNCVREERLAMGRLAEYSEREFDADGRQLVEAIFDREGRLTRRTTYLYDGAGNRVREEIDFDADGVLDLVVTREHDLAGNRVAEDSHGADGLLRSRVAWTYGDGLVVREEVDEDGDGAADTVTTLAYDETGRAARSEEDWDGDGSADRVRTYAYDAAGRTIRETDDAAVTTNAYDGCGNTTHAETDRDGDGAADVVSATRWEY